MEAIEEAIEEPPPPRYTVRGPREWPGEVLVLGALVVVDLDDGGILILIRSLRGDRR